MSGPAQATPTDVDIIFVAAANAVPVNGNSSRSEAESWSSDGGDFGSPFSWIEESSDEDLDYFAALDVVATESLARPKVREGSAPPSGAIAEEHRGERWCRSTMLVRCHEVRGVDGWGWNDPVFD
jgi:hypothetical protein